MSELKIESTNGGSRAKIVGGQTIVDEEQNTIKIPPDSSIEISCSDREDDYLTIKLQEPEKEQYTEQEPNR